MPDMLQHTDFDLNIGEVLLVHKNSLIHSFRWNEYRTGRNMDGLVLCLGGTAVYNQNGISYALEPGQMMFLPATSSYTMHCESMEPFVHFTANFSLIAADVPEQSAAAEILSGRMRYQTDPSIASHFCEQFEQLLTVWQAKRIGYRMMARALLCQMLCEYFTWAGRSIRSADDYNKLLPAKHALDGGLDKSFTVPELAELCGLSTTHFRRLFSAVFGCSPTDYRLEKQLLRAKDLLLAGEYSIAEIARASGFSDPNYFARVFRSRTGSSPREFMKQ